MTSAYSELHLKSFYSFGLGASHAHELLARAREYGYDSLALTDTNLCGALEFARLAGSLGIRPITCGELALADGTRLALLAMTRLGGTATSPGCSPSPTAWIAGSHGWTPSTCPTTPRGSYPPHRGPGRARVEAATGGSAPGCRVPA